MDTPAGFTRVVAANIQDSTGLKLLSGTLQFQPTDQNDLPIAAFAGGAGGPISEKAGIFPVAAGAIPADSFVADTSQTRLQNICYRVTVLDSQGNRLFLLRGVQVSGPVFSLDTYTPAGTPLALKVPGFNPRGPWAPSTAYALYDTLTYLGSSYTPTAPFLSGASFDATHLQLIAQRGNDGVVSGVQIAFAATRRPVENVFNPATVTMDAVLSTAGGVIGITNDPRFFVTDFITVAAGGWLVCNRNMEIAEAGYPQLGTCFYDINQQFLSGLVGVTAGTGVPVPAGAVYARFSTGTGGADGSGALTMKVYLAQSLPASATDPGIEAAAIAGSLATNLFDPSAVTLGNLLRIDGGGYYGFGDANFFVTDFFPVRAGGTVSCNMPTYGAVAGYPVFGTCFYDGQKNYISGAAGGAAGIVFAVPANAVYARTCGDQRSVNLTRMVIMRDVAIPAYYVYPGMTAAASLDLQATLTGPAAGKRLYLAGDSISAIYGGGWLPQLIANTGMVQVGQDAHTGRPTDAIFEFFGLNSSGAYTAVPTL